MAPRSFPGAAIVNALELVGKSMDEIKVVVNGAGASGIACAEHYVSLGVKRENVTLCDTKGVVYKGRKEGMNPYKERFAHETPLRSLVEAVRGADVLLGLSKKGAFTPEMIASLAPRPVVFAMANPDPEITYEEVKAVRDDLIMATGRSDFPNQVNNVLGFPFYFPRRPRRARHHHQRRNEAGRNPCAGCARQRRRPGFSLPCLRRRPRYIWA
jgi:malate dehydrogenase (oxaloacetate-decarboxylating)(NADP+)